MSVRITDVLKDPLDNPCPNTIIRVTTIVGEGSTLKYAIEKYSTDSNGLYDFNLVYGVHDIEILWTDTYEYIGTATINDGTPNPTNLQGAIDYVTPIPIPPPLSDNPSWTDLYRETICSLDSEGSHTTSQWAAGPATILQDRKVFCNARKGSAYSQFTNLVCTSPTEFNVTQNQTYSDTSGSVSSYKMDSTQVDGQSAFNEVSFTRDGVGNICSYKREVFDAGNYTEALCVSVTPSEIFHINDLTRGSYGIRRDDIFKDGGVCIIARANTQCITASQTILAADCYTCDGQIVNRAYTCNMLTQCLGVSIKTQDIKAAQQLPDGSFCTLNSYMTCVGAEKAGIVMTNDGTCSEIKHIATKHSIGYLQGSCYLPSMEIDTATGCIIFCGNVEFNSCNCENFQGPPGDSQRLDIQYSPTNSGPWDSTLDPEDRWQRYRTVTVSGIDGSLTNGPWLGPFNLYAEDGLPGDTLYDEFQYSVDGISSWHSVLIEGDKFRRERRVINGVIGEWSTPVRIVGDDGIDGTGVTVVYDYSVDALSATPIWHPNYSHGDFWRRERYYSVHPVTGVAPDPFHQLIVKIVPEKGVDYHDGVDTKVVKLFSTGQGVVYQSDGTTPNPATVTFTASPSDAVGATPYYIFKVAGEQQQAGTNPEYIYPAPTTASEMPQTVSVEVKSDASGPVVAADQITVYGLVNGSQGYDGVTVILTNEAHTFAANSDGDVYDYSDGGTSILVYIGANQLSYGTGPNKFTVTAVGNNITPDASPITEADGKTRTYRAPSSMLDVLARIGFTVQIQYEGIGLLQITKTQSFALSMDGEVGPPGQSTYTAQVYRRATSTPATPTGGSYNFSNNVLTPPANWFVSIPAGTDPVYASNNTFYVQGTGVGIADAWGTPFKFVENGTDGTAGKSTYTAYIFRRALVQPSPPPSGGCFDFGNNILTPPVNWSASIPSGTDPVWATTYTFKVIGDTGEDVAGQWATTFKYVENGEDGEHGQSTYHMSVYKRSATKPTKPVGGQYNFGTNTLSGVSGGYTLAFPNGKDPVWVSQETAVAAGPDGIDTDLNWSEPVLHVENGTSVAEVAAYKRSSVPITAAPSGGSYNFTNHTLSPPSTWCRCIYAGTAPIYVTRSTAKASGAQTIDSNLSWSSPALLSCNGTDGNAGAGYYSFNGTMPTTDAAITTCFNTVAGRVPVSGDTFVAYNESTCKTTGKQYCATGNPLWRAPTHKIDGGLIVTGTIGAAQLAANSISGEKIQANSTIIVGCKGAATKNVVGLDGNLSSCWRIYAGCSTPAAAPFRVDCLGRVYMCNATITGTMCGGTICGSTGIFCGTMCVNNLKGNIIQAISLKQPFASVWTPAHPAGGWSCTLPLYTVCIVDAYNHPRILEICNPNPDFCCLCCCTNGCCKYYCQFTEYCISGEAEWRPFFGLEAQAVPIPANCANTVIHVRHRLCAYDNKYTHLTAWHFYPKLLVLTVYPEGDGLAGCMHLEGQEWWNI
jgi:hypothetical protein